MKTVGRAMLGVGFETQWKLEVKERHSASGPYAFSTVAGKKAESWPVLQLEIPFQVGKENDASNLMVKLDTFIRENLPDLEVTNRVKQE